MSLKVQIVKEKEDGAKAVFEEKNGLEFLQLMSKFNL